MRAAPSPSSLARSLIARFSACCAIGVGAGLLACGGRAADGVGSGGSGARASIPDDEPDDEPFIIGPERETCEDNPLLAGCPFAGGGSAASAPDEPVAVPDDEPLESADVMPQYLGGALNVLATYCGACHGSMLTRADASAGINYIDDWERLFDEGLIEACSPESSRVIEVMLSGEMPPASSGWSPPTRADIGVVVAAIEIDCARRRGPR